MKTKKVIIVISILISLLICLIVYILIAKKQSIKDNNNTSTTTKVKEEISLDPEIYSSVLISSLRFYNTCNTGYTFDFSSKQKIEYKDLNKDFIYNTIYNYLTVQNKLKITKANNNGNSGFLTETNYTEELVSLNDFLLAYQTLYGIKSNDIKYEDSFNIGEYKYELNNQKDYYTKKTSSPNCFVNNIEHYVLTDQNITKDKIELTYILYYSIYEFENDNVISYATNKKDGIKICDTLSIINNENYSKFTKYKFVFVKKDQTYIFDYITLVK